MLTLQAQVLALAQSAMDPFVNPTSNAPLAGDSPSSTLPAEDEGWPGTSVLSAAQPAAMPDEGSFSVRHAAGEGKGKQARVDITADGSLATSLSCDHR